METISLVAPSYSSSRLRILENIKHLGYEQPNQQLLKMGYTKLSQNLKYLKLHQGDADKIISELSVKGRSKRSHEGSYTYLNDKQRLEETIMKDVNVEPMTNIKRKHGRREAKVEILEVSINLIEYTTWPSNINRIYLDGNNMLYVEDHIRKLVLSRKTKEGEETLARIAAKFSESLDAKEIILIFDNTRFTYQYNVTAKSGVASFKVISAAPKYATSDDALVDFTEIFNAEELVTSLFVTSDRGLQVRLSEAGINNIMKTKKWFTFAKEHIGQDVYDQLMQ